MSAEACSPNLAATLGEEAIVLRPHHLLCLFCLKGGGNPPDRQEWHLEEALAKIAADRSLLITLKTAFNCMGGPRNQPTQYDPATRRKDLQVLQQLCLAPGDTRPAKWLLQDCVPRYLPSLAGVCDLGGETGPAWRECPVVPSGAYESGLKQGVIPLRSEAEMQEAKRRSCEEIATGTRLRLRPHHLLCILCFWGSGTDAPVQGDNLWEPLIRMRDNPEIEVELVEGACQVCPPCHVYDPGRDICDGACGLRDRLKDLNTFQRLGLAPGDVRTARELYDLIWERITDIREICGNRNPTVLEWQDCGGISGGRYDQARARGRFCV